MRIFSKIKTGGSDCLTNIKNNYGKYIAKAVGVGALGMIGYDAHILGLLQSDMYSKSKDAEACIERATNTMYLSNPSAINANLKKAALHIEEEQNWRSFMNSTIGYVKGVGTSMISNVVPLGLGLLTVISSKNSIAKAGGCLLGAYGGFSILKDVLGFGQPKDLNQRF
ncbi:MAG: hypothetical protein NC390_07270 [Fusobacterium sp.]|nr:hypothetical protein [Fusobacterium sp.]